jgi:hypothetical protein
MIFRKSLMDIRKMVKWTSNSAYNANKTQNYRLNINTDILFV